MREPKPSPVALKSRRQRERKRQADAAILAELLTLRRENKRLVAALLRAV